MAGKKMSRQMTRGRLRSTDLDCLKFCAFQLDSTSCLPECQERTLGHVFVKYGILR